MANKNTATKKQTEEVETFDGLKAMDNLFENFLKPGVITKEKEIVKGLTIRVRPLTMGEISIADTVANSQLTGMDTALKMRAVGVLSLAILKINELEVPDGDFEENRDARDNLYRNLKNMPAIVIQKAYELYLESVEEQNKILLDSSEVEEAVENF